ncbi:hypothetical protein M2447_002281 [Ereboglobus sp. PH5-10]|nr:hypothetical protein [Ereboglobus sp. PH5-10]
MVAHMPQQGSCVTDFGWDGWLKIGTNGNDIALASRRAKEDVASGDKVRRKNLKTVRN